MVGRTARRLRHRAGEAERHQVEFVDERLDEAHRIVGADIVVQAIRKQRGLPTILACDETLQPELI